MNEQSGESDGVANDVAQPVINALAHTIRDAGYRVTRIPTFDDENLGEASPLL